MFEAEYTYGILYCFTLFTLFCPTCCSWSNICRVQLIVLLMNQHDILTYVRSRMFWQIQQWKQLGRTSIRTAPISSTVGQVLSCKIRENCDMHTSGFNLLGVGGWGDQLDLKHYEDVPCMWYRFKWRIVPIGNTYIQLSCCKCKGSSFAGSQYNDCTICIIVGWSMASTYDDDNNLGIMYNIMPRVVYIGNGPPFYSIYTVLHIATCTVHNCMRTYVRSTVGIP